MLKILVADDHAVVRAGVLQIVSASGDLCTGGEAASAAELLEKLGEQPWDAIILDIALRDRSGLDVLPELKRRAPATPVLILSMYGEEEFAIRAIRLGASGYLTKESAPERLVDALRTICAGGIYITPVLAQALARQLHKRGERRHDRLSPREFQILCLFGEGKSVTQIARMCSLSVKTVSTHRRNILEKLALQTTAQLVRYAIEHRLSQSRSDFV